MSNLPFNEASLSRGRGGGINPVASTFVPNVSETGPNNQGDVNVERGRQHGYRDDGTGVSQRTLESAHDQASTVLNVGDRRDVDYLNGKLKGIDPSKLSEIISRYQASMDITKFIDNISYQGFNRHEYIRSSMVQISVSQFCRLAVIGAIRGSNFEKIVKNSLLIDKDLVDLVSAGVVKKNAKVKQDITILRCTASIPHWCAYFMSAAGIPPKIADSQLPSFLQFPAAASIPMSADLRKLHVEFSIRFSAVIGGAFNPNIYMAAFNNQIPLLEIPDGLRLKLGINSLGESLAVGAQKMITESLTTVVKT